MIQIHVTLLTFPSSLIHEYSLCVRESQCQGGKEMSVKNLPLQVAARMTLRQTVPYCIKLEQRISIKSARLRRGRQVKLS